MKNKEYTTFLVECDWTEEVVVENSSFDSYSEKATEAMTRALERRMNKYMNGGCELHLSQFITAIDTEKIEEHRKVRNEYEYVNLTENVLINAGQPVVSKEIIDFFNRSKASRAEKDS